MKKRVCEREMLRECGGKGAAMHNRWKGIAAQKRRIKYNDQSMTTPCKVSEQPSPVAQPAALHGYHGICLMVNAFAASGTVQ